MLEIPGYRIDEIIHHSTHSTVCRGSRDIDNLPVVVKLARGAPPKPADVARFNQECVILGRLDNGSPSTWFLPVRYEDRLALVTWDIGAQSLTRHGVAGKLPVRAFLALAVEIVAALVEIHARQVVHKDINPHNIVWNPDTDTLKIIDFNISSMLRQEVPMVRSPNILEGTLAYIAPEQTGRMNRSVDYRADLYSLGITFYELLTGNPPFRAGDLTELVHAHLAVDPAPVHEIEPSIPRVLSDIVMKLVIKEPAGRYQSARTLGADLERCLAELDSSGTIERFEIARNDRAEVFYFPGRLYGRDREIEELRRTFEEVSAGALAMTLVSGYSGIGKSVLVHELYRPITRRRGYFISGKYDQYRRNIPYSGVVAAVQELVRELLTEPEPVLTRWREELLQAFGPNGAIIAEVVPEIELIVPRQPRVALVGPTETKNRFNRVFLDFIHVLCRPEHPLVLFLDDLQWADSASLELLQVILSSDELAYLHVVGSYRDNEVSSSHPLMIMLTRLGKEQKHLEWIRLAPLDAEEISSLLADALHNDHETVAPLARLVGERTSGNPFFVKQFLMALYHSGGLEFDHQRHCWRWDDRKVDALGLTDNVVDLMVGRVRLLPAATGNILRLAACVGNRFDLQTLALIRDEPVTEVHQQLLPAIEEGYIVPLTLPEPTDEGMNARLMAFHYRFMHDRVHQAAHSLLDEHEMKSAHLRIGRLLLSSLSAAERAERIFQIVDHLNMSRELFVDPAEVLELARLDLEAGCKAKAATAYEAARFYLATGIECLPGNAWREYHDLTMALHREYGEIEYLGGNFETSNEIFDLLIRMAATPLETAEIYALLINLYTVSGNYPAALEMCRTALGLVGVDLPDKDFEAAMQSELARAVANVGDRAILDLIDLSEPAQAETRMAIKLLSKAGPLAFLCDPDLFLIVTIRSVNLSIEHGQIAESSVGYCNYGLILASKLRRYQDGYDFGSLAQKLSRKLDNMAQKCVTGMMVGAVLNHWVKPYREVDSHYEEAYRAGLDSGELLWVGYLVSWRLYILFHQGLDLPHCLEEAERALAFSRRAKHQTATGATLGYQIVLCNLAGLTSSPTIFRTDEIDEGEFLSRYEAAKEHPVIAYYKVAKALTLYVYRDYRGALDCLEQTIGLADVVRSTTSVAEHNFYHSLTLTALYGRADAGEREAWEGILAANQDQMASWAESCPENFENRYLLVEAERARIRGDEYEAIKLYDRAIRSARTHGFVQNHALASELAARFWLELGNDTCAGAYLAAAVRGYEAWGARPKVAMLARENALLLDGPASTTSTAVSVTTFPSSSAVDLATVIKASQAISSEIVLDSLLARLLDIVLENVGAEFGFAIIADENGELALEAGAAVKDGAIPALSYPQPLDAVDPASGAPLLPRTILNYVSRTGTAVVLEDAAREGLYASDPYVVRRQPRSLMCTPITSRGQLCGLLYLENNLIAGAFTAARVNVLQLLTSQISISLENAHLYRENERARVAAEAASRAKSTFLATMSHELRTPLNVIIGYAELVCEEASDESARGLREDLETIRVTAHNLTAVLGSILDLAKIEAGHVNVYRERIDVRGLLHELADAVQPMLVARRNSFTLRVDDEIHEIHTDKTMLRQMLLNLLGNACKFTEGGKIELEVHDASSSEGRWVKFVVSDTGIGISAEEKARVFDAFVQADSSTTRKYGGTGLGLTICRKFAETLGGRILLESSEGKGSSFTVYLPA